MTGPLVSSKIMQPTNRESLYTTKVIPLLGYIVESYIADLAQRPPDCVGRLRRRAGLARSLPLASARKGGADAPLDRGFERPRAAERSLSRTIRRVRLNRDSHGHAQFDSRWHPDRRPTRDRRRRPGRQLRTDGRSDRIEDLGGPLGRRCRIHGQGRRATGCRRLHFRRQRRADKLYQRCLWRLVLRRPQQHGHLRRRRDAAQRNGPGRCADLATLRRRVSGGCAIGAAPHHRTAYLSRAESRSQFAGRLQGCNLNPVELTEVRHVQLLHEFDRHRAIGVLARLCELQKQTQLPLPPEQSTL